MTNSNPLTALQQFGQSVWLDDLRRGLFTSGKFGRLIAEDGLRGVTSNPSIFEKAMAGTTEYAASLREIDRDTRMAPVELYEALASVIFALPPTCFVRCTRPLGGRMVTR